MRNYFLTAALLLSAPLAKAQDPNIAIQTSVSNAASLTLASAGLEPERVLQLMDEILRMVAANPPKEKTLFSGDYDGAHTTLKSFAISVVGENEFTERSGTIFKDESRQNLSVHNSGLGLKITFTLPVGSLLSGILQTGDSLATTLYIGSVLERIIYQDVQTFLDIPTAELQEKWGESLAHIDEAKPNYFWEFRFLDRQALLFRNPDKYGPHNLGIWRQIKRQAMRKASQMNDLNALPNAHAEPFKAEADLTKIMPDNPMKIDWEIFATAAALFSAASWGHDPDDYTAQISAMIFNLKNLRSTWPRHHLFRWESAHPPSGLFTIRMTTLAEQNLAPLEIQSDQFFALETAKDESGRNRVYLHVLTDRLLQEGARNQNFREVVNRQLLALLGDKLSTALTAAEASFQPRSLGDDACGSQF